MRRGVTTAGRAGVLVLQSLEIERCNLMILDTRIVRQFLQLTLLRIIKLKKMCQRGLELSFGCQASIKSSGSGTSLRAWQAALHLKSLLRLQSWGWHLRILI
jgi:hypothetical protein